MPKKEGDTDVPDVTIDVPPWHCMTKEEVIKAFKLNEDVRRTGLTSDQAAERLEKFGENKLTEQEKESLLQKIWNQVNNVLVGILVFVAVISAVSAITGVGDPVQSWIQVGIIFGVIM